ncbi:MAG: phospholipid/cholesterol/gamma-HCH transport system substrate-binding protein [Solirubrobacteraceae bacterium]|nr:phospholipid/cholesterol/gamma-HCH transport system substrate-binding protein [Solirubrobacteraceae bacterium]
MQKQAPTLGRLLTMTLFALSCFGLLLFLWLAFGGPVPLKPKGYRFKVAFPEATQLAEQADVRIAGVSVGKVTHKDINLKTEPNRTIATIQLDSNIAPLHADARAILRQKTLLGETYVELTPGTNTAKRIPEDGWLANAQVHDAVQLDEIFQALDPVTRRAFQNWQQDLAKGINGHGQDFNDAIGNLPTFIASGDDVLGVLDAQSAAVRRLIRNTGVTFGALTQNERQLHNLITNSEDTFGALASQNNALAETFHIFPTFLDESKKTFVKLEAFSKNTRPLIHDLRPVARDLRPTLRAVKAFAPDLENTFRKLDPLITASRTGLPALTSTLKATTPALAQLQPFLEQLNPILQYLEYYQWQTADFISNGAGALADTVATTGGGQRGHYLRQWGPTGQETAAFWPTRPGANRGNAYLPPVWQGPEYAKRMIFPESDCANVTTKNADGGTTRQVTPATSATTSSPDDSNPAPGGSEPSCWIFPPKPAPPGGTPGQFPHVAAADYSK